MSSSVRCEMWGNDYDKVCQITAAGQSHLFDSFECAIQIVAPSCVHCGCRIIGHDVEVDGAMFCCAHLSVAFWLPPICLRDSLFSA